MPRIDTLLSAFPRASLLAGPTPLERLNRLSAELDIDLWIKRDDLTGLSFGGNKTRQLEFYIGAARAAAADTILITGAVQSNFTRTAAAAAAKYGMQAVLQREERVPGMDPLYHSSGNVFLSDILGAGVMIYPGGEDETGADAALETRAEDLRAEGRNPYIIPLGLGHPPLGALGYVQGGAELAAQIGGFDAAVVPSGSGATHAGFLTGVRLAGITSPVFGICVRRDAALEKARLEAVADALADLIGIPRPFGSDGILTWDGALAPGYGRAGPATRAALQRMARAEGILLDPVYSAKTFAGLLGLLEEGSIRKGQKVLLLHTGGLPALFAYQNDLGFGGAQAP
ncbi:D-cysteine desulfhydrase family protein [Leisingera sp. HS039]|uniref:D-cysteine desulfhydrase family protein n=1 Tax=unclassified Leisingera TaxID=2614906 RepID=UPI001070F755|nr:MULTISPECIES: D-cysteine desulfhydrase family protein [unclassified Leisingera]MBQ4824053.1 D-cysteine desulfhydrase family protein [Leisingera sp. HS039]QBR35194.1 D-cysteine desulfhydrase family protein [Leisingera sp. NJS201]